MSCSFEEKFWKEALKDPFALIIGGCCYHVEKYDSTDSKFKGMVSSLFKIEILKDTGAFKKGEIVVTNNLCYRGELPDWCYVENNAKCTEDSPTKLIDKSL